MQSLINKMMKVGIPEGLAREQIRLIQRGTRYCDIVSFASIGNGILVLSDEEVSRLSELYDNRSSDVKVWKFVPASGAATRMFKSLIQARATRSINEEAQVFFENISHFPFSDSLDLSQDRFDILDELLDEGQLNMDAMPKGSILFHRYGEESRTAFEEHLVEGVDYATSGGMVHIHFTIAPEAMEKIMKDMDNWSKKYSRRLGCEYDLQFSIQQPSTDTVPFDIDKVPLLNKNGTLITRPGGHGSLIYNLNELQADLIFIKNVDNVVPDKNREETIRYKKALAGLLMEVRNEARRIISSLKADDNKKTMDSALTFLKKMGTELSYRPKRGELIRLMNRPYRVCGMVRNQGEPGGGPFWVKSKDKKSLQIVESAQIDKDDPDHIKMLKEGTHFNPVDLVCSLNDLYGMKQDLLDFMDDESAFVTVKQINGQDALVIEWPGLWNGAMDDWNTLFVEVPISTFNPVKTVNDLLRPMHR